MSRMSAADRIVVKPVNNVYTALAGSAVLVTLAALIVLIVRIGALFPEFKWM